MTDVFWFNFKTGEYTQEQPTEETATEYFSQDPSAQSLYLCYRALGDPMMEAIIKVLKDCLGIKQDEEVE